MQNRKKVTIGILCLVLIIMGVGYAILSGTLNISGTAKVSGIFDVQITNIILVEKSTKVTDTTQYIQNGNYGTVANLSAVFNEPGDYIIYEITASNLGTIDAIINVATTPQSSTSGSFKMTCTAIRGIVLQATTGTTRFQCKMIFDENRELNSEQFPEVQSASLQIQINAEQKVGSSIEPLICYQPLNETKVLGVINGNIKTAISTYGVGNIQVGDLLGFGTSDIDSNEQFYVIEKNGTTLKLLSRYDLNVGSNQKEWDFCNRDTRGLQDKDMSLTRKNVDDSSEGFTIADPLSLMQQNPNLTGLYGSLLFSNNNYWFDEANNAYLNSFDDNAFVYNANTYLKIYIDRYVSSLNSMGLNATNGSMLSIQEVGALCGTDYTGGSGDDSGCPNYLFETMYWLGSIKSGKRIWNINMGYVNHDNYDTPGAYGLRPVITVALS